MSIYRYSQWVGHKVTPDLDADGLMSQLQRSLMSPEFLSEMREDLVSYADLSYALKLMQRKGVRDKAGRRVQGLQSLLQQLRQERKKQIARAQSLLNSLPPEEAKALREALKDLLGSALDEGAQRQQTKQVANPEAVQPSSRTREQYPLSGKEAISRRQSEKLMEMLRKMGQLEGQLKDAQYSRSLDVVDEQLVKELIGDEAAEELKRLRKISRILEEAGYIRDKDGSYQLTPRGMRKIGQMSLEDIFTQLRKDGAGGHDLYVRGRGGERIEETKRYEFGDDFQPHLQQTIMNSLHRKPSTPPIKLTAQDFEVYKSEAVTRSATVLMVDLSSSMATAGNFEAAKRMAISLDSLIRSQYPNDSLHIIGFSSYARQIKRKDLPRMTWDSFDPYTNMQQGFRLAEKLLDRERCNNQHIILISDGEPTAHTDGGNVCFQTPPTRRTLRLTLKEVRNCTQRGIRINTFMLENGRFPRAFVTQMARINKGRVFFTSANTMGQYLLLDYVSNRRKRRRT